MWGAAGRETAVFPQFGGPEPSRTGLLVEGNSCTGCAAEPQPELMPPYGVTNPNCDDGHGDDLPAQYDFLQPFGTTHTQGATSPLVLNHGFNLAQLPAGARVFSVEPSYEVYGGQLKTVTDNGGSKDAIAISDGFSIYWSIEAVQQAKGAGNGVLSVHAEMSFTVPPTGEFTAGSAVFGFRPPTGS